MSIESLIAGRKAALQIWPMTPGFCYGGAFLAWDASAPIKQQWTLQGHASFCPLDVLDSAPSYRPELRYVETDRQVVEVVVQEKFPGMELQLERLGCDHGKLLHKPLRNMADAMEWLSSYWCGATPWFADTCEGPGNGESRYLAVTDVAQVEDEEGLVTVGTLADRKVIVVWGEPGSVMEKRRGEVLGPRHPVSLKAYRNLAVTS